VNCLDYRRVLLTGTGETEDMRAHRIGCASCAETHKEHLAFEGELRRAMEVPVPEGIAERLSARLGGGGTPARPAAFERRRFLAAASVAAVAAGAGLYLWRGRDDPLAMACILFVAKEEAKSIMMGAMPRAEAAAALADTLPLERLDRLGKVMHIGPCPFEGGTAYHVVLMVPQEKVTLLVMPGRTMPRRRRATHDGMVASVVPLAGGSVGIVGASAAVVDSVAGALLG
jgi:hypothetical protein